MSTRECGEQEPERALAEAWGEPGRGSRRWETGEEPVERRDFELPWACSAAWPGAIERRWRLAERIAACRRGSWWRRSGRQGGHSSQGEHRKAVACSWRHTWVGARHEAGDTAHGGGGGGRQDCSGCGEAVRDGDRGPDRDGPGHRGLHSSWGFPYRHYPALAAQPADARCCSSCRLGGCGGAVAAHRREATAASRNVLAPNEAGCERPNQLRTRGCGGREERAWVAAGRGGRIRMKPKAGLEPTVTRGCEYRGPGGGGWVWDSRRRLEDFGPLSGRPLLCWQNEASSKVPPTMSSPACTRCKPTGGVEGLVGDGAALTRSRPVQDMFFGGEG